MKLKDILIALLTIIGIEMLACAVFLGLGKIAGLW